MITILQRGGLANDYSILCPVVESTPSLQPNFKVAQSLQKRVFCVKCLIATKHRHFNSQFGGHKIISKPITLKLLLGACEEYLILIS